MIRKAFVMQVDPDKHAEYERRHNPIWPELAAVLKEHGAHNYSIFLHAASSQLFAYVEIEDQARWWAHMRDVMPSHPDNRPVAADLREVFHLD